MPHGLRRLQQSGQSHFVTFTCYHRRPGLVSACACDFFMEVLESMRRRFAMRVYGFVVMPEHVHLLISEPERGVLADAIHYLKLSFAKRVQGLCRELSGGVLWQKRYDDRNIRNESKLAEKLRYIHRNPVKRGLVKEPAEWKWSSSRHYGWRETGAVNSGTVAPAPRSCINECR